MFEVSAHHCQQPPDSQHGHTYTSGGVASDHQVVFSGNQVLIGQYIKPCFQLLVNTPERENPPNLQNTKNLNIQFFSHQVQHKSPAFSPCSSPNFQHIPVHICQLMVDSCLEFIKSLVPSCIQLGLNDAPQIFNRIQVWRVGGPLREELYSGTCMP
jgi:hypothetical protein